MADKVIYKGGKTVVGAKGSIQLVLPKASHLHKFLRWWNKKPGAYIDVAIFKVTLDNGVQVRLVVPATERMNLEIRHDGFGNFTFPQCRVDRIAVVAIDSTQLLLEYQFSKISGGKVLKRTLAGIPAPVAPEPEPEPEPKTTEDDLEAMTKQQLLDWAMDQGHDLVDGHKKAELLQECMEILAAG